MRAWGTGGLAHLTEETEGPRPGARVRAARPAESSLPVESRGGPGQPWGAHPTRLSPPAPLTRLCPRPRASAAGTGLCGAGLLDVTSRGLAAPPAPAPL